MKKLVLKSFVKSVMLVFLCLSACTSIVAQEKDRKFHLSFGLAPIMIGDNSFFGGNFSFGYILPSKKYQLAIDIGGGRGAPKKIGEYGYTITTTNSSGQVINTETKTDGKVTYAYYPMLFSLTWNWLFDLSEKWAFRVGPAIGLLEISGRETYSPTSYKGNAIDGIPESQSETKQTFMGGVIAGVTYNFGRRWFFDIGYGLSVSQGIDFHKRNQAILGSNVTIEGKEFGSIGNRINLSVGWRF
jgi:hypothetical protein